MRRRAFLPVISLLLLSVMAPTAFARDATQVPDSLPGSLTTVRATHIERSLPRISSPREVAETPAALGADVGATAATADIQVTYHGFSVAAQAAFEAAVNVWETQIVSSAPIRVDATWTNLGATTGILGQAGPTYLYRNGTSTWYPVALAEALCACSKNGSQPDIVAEFNSAFSGWYLGIDGKGASSKYDFMTVVLHELGHGLGFISSFEVAGGRGSWGWDTDYPLAFDTHEWSELSGGKKLTTGYANNSAALKTQLTDGGVYFGGSNVKALLGKRARLYAPGSWNPGSSNSHLDENTYAAGTQNALMTPFLANGEVIHDPGPLTLAVFRDIGWQTGGSQPPSVPDAPTGVSATAGNGSASVSWQPPANGGSPITGYAVTSTPDSQTCQTSGATSCTVSGLANGTAYTFTVVATNAVGSSPSSAPSAPVTPTEQSIDATGPSVERLDVSVVSPAQMGKKAVLRVSWPAATDESGITAYELQRKKGSKAWTIVSLGSATATQADVSVKPGTFRFRVRATDGAGNVGPWLTVGPSTLTRYQEKAAQVTLSGTWKKAAVASASGGYVRYSGKAGNSATLSFSGTSVGFVTSRGPARGIAEIRLDGSLVASVDLYAASSSGQRVVWAPDAPLAAGAHTLEVVVSGTRNAASTKNRVDVDAFLVWN